MIPSRRDESIVDNFHGTLVFDPYRWLEDSDSAEVREWVNKQNAYTRSFIDKNGQTNVIQERLAKLMDYPRFGVLSRKYATGYFFMYNYGLQNQSVLYRAERFDDEHISVIDPNLLSDDGNVALLKFNVSYDGALVAYSTSQSGSDYREIHVRRVLDGVDLTDIIQRVKFVAIAWSPDSKGFYYNYNNKSDNNARIYYHDINNPQESDKLIFESPESPELNFTPSVTPDNSYLILDVWKGSDPHNRFYLREINGNKWQKLLDDADATYNFIGNIGPIFYFHTTLHANRGRVVSTNIDHPSNGYWTDIIPENNLSIDCVKIIGEHVVVVYLLDAYHVVHIYTLGGSFVSKISIPSYGTVFDISGMIYDQEMFFGFTSFLIPSSIYCYNFTSNVLKLIYSPAMTFLLDEYETKQFFYSSKDNTSIPMFLVARKEVNLDGENPTLLFGYGGFGIALSPNFVPTRLEWLQQGGILAFANIRGGNEYGEPWHEAGMLSNKQNVFDDFIAAADWLVSNKFTSSSKLAIWGGSNGGLLVAACEVQRPDLFGAVICNVPVIDMLRYKLFTIGRYWVGEYGDAYKNSVDFMVLYAYFPLHNIKSNIMYPPTLILSSEGDDRVVPVHARKLAASLQWACGDSRPILLRMEGNSGHGLGKPTSKVIIELADIYGFLYQVLGIS